MTVSDIRLASATCPGCGAALDLPEDKSVVRCPHCGGSIVVEEVLKKTGGPRRRAEELVALAEAEMGAGDYPRANRLLDDALKVDGENAAAWIKKAACVHALSMADGFDRTDAVIKYAGTGIGRDPALKGPAVETLVACAGSAMNGERYQQARDLLDAALKIDGENALAWMNRGICAYNLPGDYDARVGGMLDCMKKAAGRDPGVKKRVSGLIAGMVELPERPSANDARAALKSLMEAYRYDPGNGRVVEAMAHVVVAAASGPGDIGRLMEGIEASLIKRVAERAGEIRRLWDEGERREAAAASKRRLGRLRRIAVAGAVVLAVVIAALVIRFFLGGGF